MFNEVVDFISIYQVCIDYIKRRNRFDDSYRRIVYQYSWIVSSTNQTRQIFYSQYFPCSKPNQP